MLFNSIVFALFLPIVFFVYWSGKMQKTVRRRNLWLVLSSFAFYGWWDIRFLILLVCTTMLDFFVANRMERTTTPLSRKRWLFLSLAGNLGVLGFFKYFDFFSQSLEMALKKCGIHADFVVLNIMLPVGLSFYTFQAMSYILDVYYRKVPAEKNALTYFTYISFFPQLVAGPIERAAHMLPQFRETKTFKYDNAISGLRLMLYGFFKKCVIADNLAPVANAVFDKNAHPDSLAVTFGIIAFAIQAYGDFSGYSDIARGTARLFGFEVMQNFRFPYFANSVRDYWRRWHISLSLWFNDYVFTPLAFALRNYAMTGTLIALFTTFFLIGLWHGANWTFVFWGIWQGTAIIIELIYKKLRGWKFPKIARHILVLASAWISYVFIRSPSLDVAFDRLTSLFTCSWNVAALSAYVPKQWPSPVFGICLLFLILFLFLFDLVYFKNKLHWFLRRPRWFRWMSYSIVIVILLLFGVYQQPPAFMYAQF